MNQREREETVRYGMECGLTAKQTWHTVLETARHMRDKGVPVAAVQQHRDSWSLAIQRVYGIQDARLFKH